MQANVSFNPSTQQWDTGPEYEVLGLVVQDSSAQMICVREDHVGRAPSWFHDRWWRVNEAVDCERGWRVWTVSIMWKRGCWWAKVNNGEREYEVAEHQLVVRET